MPVPDRMQFIDLAGFGGPEVLRLAAGPIPRPKTDEVLIQVAAAGMNRGDILQRAGNYPPPPGVSPVLGLEVSGTVAAVGNNVTEWCEGQEVCALLAGGGYAEYCTAPAPQCLPIPQGVGLIEAAALPETYFTVWTNVFDRGRLAPGESLLVHGGSSGIGTTAIQLAHASGARVFATAGSSDKCAVCQQLGAERAINYRQEDFVSVVKQLTGGAGVDVILDIVGGTYAERNQDALAVDGRLVQIGIMEGSKITLDLFEMMVRRQTITGNTLRARSVADKAVIARSVRERVWPLIEAGAIKTVVDRTFPLSEVAAAHRLMETSQHIGKILLTM